MMPSWAASAVQAPNFRIPIAISLGAIGGALSRYYLTVWFASRWGIAFPYGTFFINLTGCFAMGFFVTLVERLGGMISPDLRLLIAVGFLGAYTTFSTYELDAHNLVQAGHFRNAMFYWGGSAMLGFLGIQFGVTLAWLLTR
ncbi:MAG: fluoride efflux transporter CrcB [Microcoleaceae cyanobacterium]